MTWVNWRRMCRGAMDAGWMDLLIRRAVDRVSSREALGKPLAEIQTVGNILAEMRAEQYAARATSIMVQAELDEL